MYNKTGEIIIDYYDKILISYVSSSEEKCCRECLLKRFINTRKDRIFISKKDNYKLNEESIYVNIISELITYLKSCLDLIDKYGRRKVFILDKNTLCITSSYFISVPDCQICSNLSKDSSTLSEMEGTDLLEDLSNNKYGSKFRKRSAAEWDLLLEEFVLDKNVGIISTLLDYFEYAFSNAVAILPLENGKDEPGTGRTNNLKTSRGIALLEAMERYAGFQPRGKKTVTYDSYKNLSNHAINVNKLILNEDSVSNKNPRYKNDVFKFNLNKNYHWVYGYNLTQRRSQLIPETVAYYGMKLKDKKYTDEIFVYEISNGCSVGGSILEATYFGLLEVIERDAFLTSWYIQHTIKRILYTDITNANLISDLEVYNKNYSDFILKFYEISNDVEVPVVLATITRKKISTKKMNFMCAASANFDIQKAMLTALHEITSIFYGLQKKFEENYQNIAFKSENFDQINTMEDHSLAYGYYKNIDKIIFDDEVVEFKQVSDYINEEDNIETLYKKILSKLRSLNKDIIFINQTTE